MVNTGKRTQKRVSKRTPSKTKKFYYREKSKKISCAITGKKLSGSSKASKKSKTQKRPSVPFGGVLSGEAREQVFVELGKVIAGIKTIEEVEQKYRKYVKQAMKRVE